MRILICLSFWACLCAAQELVPIEKPAQRFFETTGAEPGELGRIVSRWRVPNLGALEFVSDKHHSQGWRVGGKRIFSLFLDPVKVWQDVGGAEPNIIRVSLHEKGLKPYLVNWVEFAHYFQHQLNKELAGNPYNREARELLDEIQGYPGITESTDPSTAAPKPYLPMKLKKGDIELQFFSMVSTFGTPLYPPKFGG